MIQQKIIKVGIVFFDIWVFEKLAIFFLNFHPFLHNFLVYFFFNKKPGFQSNSYANTMLQQNNNIWCSFCETGPAKRVD